MVDRQYVFKSKNAKWVAMCFMLETQPRAPYKKTIDAIAAYQTKLDLLEADEKNKNVTVAVAKPDTTKKVADDLKWFRSFYAGHQKGGKGGGGKNYS